MCLPELAVRVFITVKRFPFIFKITSLAYLRYSIVTAWSVRKRMHRVKSCKGPSWVPCCWPYWVKKMESLWLTRTLHHLSPVRSVHTERLGWWEGSVWKQLVGTQTWLEFMPACTRRVPSVYRAVISGNQLLMLKDKEEAQLLCGQSQELILTVAEMWGI